LNDDLTGNSKAVSGKVDDAREIAVSIHEKPSNANHFHGILKKLVPPENGEQFCHPLDF
jgi:hypothetical protein